MKWFGGIDIDMSSVGELVLPALKLESLVSISFSDGVESIGLYPLICLFQYSFLLRVIRD